MSGSVPVAHAGFGEQMAGPARVVFEFAAQVNHVEHLVRLADAGGRTEMDA
jgi:hypothetical protein